MKQYYYKCMRCPATAGMIPRGVIGIIDLNSRTAPFSIAVYQKKLSQHELYKFDLVECEGSEKDDLLKTV